MDLTGELFHNRVIKLVSAYFVVLMLEFIQVISLISQERKVLVYESVLLVNCGIHSQFNSIVLRKQISDVIIQVTGNAMICR